MVALGLPTNAAFYDFDPGSSDPSSFHSVSTDLIFQEWVEDSTRWSWCQKAHTLEDVAWLTYPQETHRLAQANAECHPYASMPFEEAMRLWGTSGQAWLGWWLSERWMIEGGWYKIEWTEFSRWMHDQMWKTYLDRGCSDSTCEGCPSPGLVPTEDEYITRQSTPNGRTQ